MMLAGLLGALKDAMGQTPGGAGTVEAPIAAYPNFEHLEAAGQRRQKLQWNLGTIT